LAVCREAEQSLCSAIPTRNGALERLAEDRISRKFLAIV
jgi:hypothetical protein